MLLLITHLNSSPSHPNKDLIYNFLAIIRKIDAKTLKKIFVEYSIIKGNFFDFIDKLVYPFSFFKNLNLNSCIIFINF